MDDIKLSVQDCRRLMNRELGTDMNRAVLVGPHGLSATSFLGLNLVVSFELLRCEDGTPYISMIVRLQEPDRAVDDEAGRLCMLFDPMTLNRIRG